VIARGGSPRPIKQYLTDSPKGINWIKISDSDKGGKYINQTKEKIIPEGVSKSRLVHKGDFLLTNSMSFGRPYILNVDGCIHDGWLVLSGYFQGFDKDFLFYLLSSRFAYYQFCDVVSGAVVKNLNSDKVAAALFPLPPLPEQRRIVQTIEKIEPLISEHDGVEQNLFVLNETFPARLKKSILQQAVQGKLVPQDPSDESAEVLLKRIQAEKQRLVREGKIKKDKHESVIFRRDNSHYEIVDGVERCIDEELLFEIPEGWYWTRLMDVCEYIQRGKSPKYSTIKKYPVIAQKCNQWSGFSIEKAQFIEPDSLASYGSERILQDNDLMWNSTGLGTLGRMAIYKATANPYGLAVADSHVTVIRPFKQFVLPEYLYFYFSNPTVQSVIEEQADGTTKQKELATATIKAYWTPIPPLNEQYRIVAKIKELLPLIQSI